jgi:antitoxin MazE
MKARVQKWGNSLALRIPKAFALEAGLSADTAVDLSLVNGALVVGCVKPKPITLDELLRGVTDKNCPGEWNTGAAVAKRHEHTARSPLRSIYASHCGSIMSPSRPYAEAFRNLA